MEFPFSTVLLCVGRVNRMAQPLPNLERNAMAKTFDKCPARTPPPSRVWSPDPIFFWWYSYNGSKILLGGLWGVPNVCDTQCVRRCVNICLLPGSALSPSAQFPTIALFVRYLASCSVSVLHLYSLGLPTRESPCSWIGAGFYMLEKQQWMISISFKRGLKCTMHII